MYPCKFVDIQVLVQVNAFELVLLEHDLINLLWITIWPYFWRWLTIVVLLMMIRLWISSLFHMSTATIRGSVTKTCVELIENWKIIKMSHQLHELLIKKYQSPSQLWPPLQMLMKNWAHTCSTELVGSFSWVDNNHCLPVRSWPWLPWAPFRCKDCKEQFIKQEVLWYLHWIMKITTYRLSRIAMWLTNVLTYLPTEFCYHAARFPSN